MIESTWIGEKKANQLGRKQPKFRIDLWNVYNRARHGLTRSTNALEAFHKNFGDNQEQPIHPTVSQLLEGLHRQQMYTNLAMAQIERGDLAVDRKEREKHNERLTQLIATYDIDKNGLNLIKGVALANMAQYSAAHQQLDNGIPVLPKAPKPVKD